MKTQYLITGAAGNLGSSVARALVAAGNDVRALVLPGDEAAARLPAAVKQMEGNILNPKDLQEFFAVEPGTEACVIHCAGLVSTVWAYDPEVFRVNVGGTENVVNECLKAGVKKLVYTSSVHAIPELPNNGLMTEITEFEPESIVGFYGKTKAMASRIVMQAVREHGLDATIVFPSGLCGPEDYAYGYVTELLTLGAANKLPAGVKGGYDFADVRDVAAGVVAACAKGKSGETYILGNRFVAVQEILTLVHELAAVPLVKRMVAPAFARCLLPVLTLISKIKQRRPLVTRYALYTLTSNANFSSEKARRELDYTTRPFRETVRDTLEWLRAEGKID